MKDKDRTPNPLTDHDAAIQRAMKTGKPVRMLDGTVVLDPTRRVMPIEYARPTLSWEQRMIELLSRKNDEAGEDTVEEFYDFGPPSDEWDDFNSPYEMPEPRDNYGWYEDMETSSYYNPSSSQQPSVNPQEAEQSNLSVSEEQSPQESD